MTPAIDRVYDSSRARKRLGWTSHYDFQSCIDALRRDDDPFSPLSRAVGKKGYHDRAFEDGPFPVDE